MADVKLPDITNEVTAVADDDYIYVVDKSDTTDSADGSSGYAQASNVRMLPNNVKFYGALGDGSNDDTAAIALAITAAGSTGWVVFPAGTYMVSTLALTNNVRWRADGEATIKCNNVGAVDDFFILITGSYSSEFRGLTFDGNSKIGRLINCVNTSDAGAGETVTVKDCHFKNTESNTVTATGIRLDGGFDKLHVSNCTFDNIQANGTNKVANGVQTDGNTTYYTKKVFASDCTF